MLRCASSKEDLPVLDFHPVLCNRLGGTVRIGDSNTLTEMQENSELVQMAIEPYGLSQLQDGGSVVKLQLNLPFRGNPLDSLAFAGLPDLRILHAWRAPIALESCSLAGLPWLENLVISCASTFDHFLTFGPAFRSVRISGCFGHSLQFICNQCIQRPEFSVLRVFPGPPSTGGIVVFERSSNFTQSNSSVSLRTCRLGVCSDDHLCRYNYPLKLARSYSPQKSSYKTTATLLPQPSTQPSLKTGRRFLTIFLPALLVVFAVLCAVCMLMFMRISRALRRTSYRHRSLFHSHIAVHTPQHSNWTTPLPLNNIKTKA